MKAWPMRTVGFAARHLLGSVVRGEPMEFSAGALQVYAYATNVSILGPEGGDATGFARPSSASWRCTTPT